MATNNFTADRKYKLHQEQDSCSAPIIGGIHSHLIGLSVINIFIAITAFLGNTLILVALQKQSSLHPPSKLLFRTLATTNLCVGIILEPLTVTAWMSAVHGRWQICHFAGVVAFATGYDLCSVSLLTLTAISVDTLLALLLGLRYRLVVTLKRTYVTVTVSWVLPIVFTSIYFLNRKITSWYGKIVPSMCLVILVFSYVKIFFVLRHNQIQVQNNVRQGQPNQTIPLNTVRYRKTVSSVLWVQLAFVVCYLPYGIVVALNTQIGQASSPFLAWQFAATSICLNSSLNPILYCWKIREVKQAVKETVRQFCCSWT